MCLAGQCKNCKQVFLYRPGSPILKGETIGEHLVRLATESVDEDFFWCTDCLNDRERWESEGGK